MRLEIHREDKIWCTVIRNDKEGTSVSPKLVEFLFPDIKLPEVDGEPVILNISVEKKRITPTPPRYDDVFLEGTKMLDKLAEGK